MTHKIDDILAERKQTHGRFEDVAYLTEALARTFGLHDPTLFEDEYRSASSMKKKAIYMLFSKLARIRCGDSDFLDHWDDLAGYPKLVSNYLRKQKEK
jgi:hypothetical protein